MGSRPGSGGGLSSQRWAVKVRDRREDTPQNALYFSALLQLYFSGAHPAHIVHFVASAAPKSSPSSSSKSAVAPNASGDCERRARAKRLARVKLRAAQAGGATEKLSYRGGENQGSAAAAAGEGQGSRPARESQRALC